MGAYVSTSRKKADAVSALKSRIRRGIKVSFSKLNETAIMPIEPMKLDIWYF